jgi:hypothetical protein
MNRLNIELKPGTVITINDDHSIFIQHKNKKHSSRKQVDESIENIKEYIINKYQHRFEIREIGQWKLEVVRVI